MKKLRSRKWDYLAVDKPQENINTNFVHCRYCGWRVDLDRNREVDTREGGISYEDIFIDFDSAYPYSSENITYEGKLLGIKDPVVHAGCPNCGTLRIR